MSRYSHKMSTILPGYTNSGTPCLHCKRSQEKYKTYCSIASHHKTRQIKDNKKTPKFSLEKFKNVNKITEDYPARNLIVATILLFPELSSLQDVLKMTNRVKTTQLASYLVNLQLSSDSMICNSVEIGKRLALEFPNIQESQLVKRGTPKKLWNLDIIIRNKKNQSVGLIIPSKFYLFEAPLTHFVSTSLDMKEKQKNILQENGFNPYNYMAFTNDKNACEVMSYSPHRNPYLESIISKIYQDKEQLLQKLKHIMCFRDISHPIYLVRKTKTILINNPEMNTVKWGLSLDLTHTRKPSLRYNITLNQEVKYQMYISWKEHFHQDPVIRIM